MLPGIRFSRRKFSDPVRPEKGFSYSLEVRGGHQALGSDTGLLQGLASAFVNVRDFEFRFSNPEDPVQLGSAEVGIDEEDATPVERQTDREYDLADALSWQGGFRARMSSWSVTLEWASTVVVCTNTSICSPGASITLWSFTSPPHRCSCATPSGSAP